jgi:hypothetical protein
MKKIESISKSILEDLYIVKELPMWKIAKILGIGCMTVHRRLKEFGIKARTTSEVTMGEKNPFYGKHHTQETKKKIGDAERGEKNHFYGKHRSEEDKRKISESQKGKYVSEETRKKISEAHWKGGLRVAWLRYYSKRKQLGFKLLNKPFKNSEGHHLQDKETVIFIPKELHHRVYHNNWTGQNMNIIDALALNYLELQILGEVI